MDCDRIGGCSWLGTIKDGAIEAADGIGDAAWSLFTFPENITKYVTGTDAHYGQGRSWSNFGSAAQFDWSMNNPALRVVETVNSSVYGGLNLVLGYTPYYLAHEVGLDIPYFTPPPATFRGQVRDTALLATMLFAPQVASMGRRTMGIPEKTVPAAESAVARLMREQEAILRMTPDERALATLFANPQTGAIRWPFGNPGAKVVAEVKPPMVDPPVAWRLEAEVYSGRTSPDMALHQLTELAKKGDGEAVDILGRLGDQRPDLVDDVASALSDAARAGNEAAASKISHLARLYPGYSLRWTSARGQ